MMAAQLDDVAGRGEPLAVLLASESGIYGRFGLPWGVEAEKNMRGWLAANPQGKHGRHRYSLEEFGLDRAAIDRLFPGYPQCFGLPAEES